MEKVKLPREVAKAIEEVREHYKSGFEYDLEAIKRESFHWMVPLIGFVEEDRENMALYFKALVNGYEVEETPEEKVREIYERSGRGAQVVVEEVLDTLNIKIEGVNT